MKGLKKLVTTVLAGAMAAVLAFGTGSAAQVQAAGEGKVTVTGCIEGEKYSLYKLLDFEPAGDGGVYVVTEDSDWYTFLSGRPEVTLTAVTNEEGKYYVTWAAETDPASVYGRTGEGTAAEAITDAAGVQAFAKAALAYGEANNLKITELTAGESKTVEFANLDLGYYLVGSTGGALVSLDTTNKNASVIEKNDVPTSEKKVKENNGSEQEGDLGDKSDANIGDVVEFQSTVSIPAGGSTNVVFTDEMTDSLDLIASTITLDTDAANYTLATTAHGFTVTFDNDYTENITAATVVTIKYNATLNENAIVYGSETSSEWGGGNDNKSRITYGNAGETIWDWTRTYTYPVNIKKVDGDGANANPLAGAKFELYQGTEVTENSVAIKLTAVTIITDANDKTNPNVYKVDPNGTVTEMVTPASGKLLINGLDANSYALLETEAPLGYNKLTAPETFTIDSNTDTAQGNDNSKQTAISVSNTKGDVVTIINTTGVLLPSTGGIGTTIFYIIGGILIVAGVAYFIVRRKANAE